jgi:hypothetical protein
MNMVNTAMPGPLTLQGRAPFVRIGVCVACEPISQDASSSAIGTSLVKFLSRDPAAGLTLSLTDAGDHSWVRLAGHGALRLEAILGDPDDSDAPVASAMLLPPVTGMQMYGRADGIACLWLHIEPRRPEGALAPPASLPTWHERLQRAVSLGAGFAEFLALDLGLTTSDDPDARVGVMLNAVQSMAELVDIGSLRTLPGATPSSQFLGYAIADPTGKSVPSVARSMLGQLCEYTLNLDNFETVLASL